MLYWNVNWSENVLLTQNRLNGTRALHRKRQREREPLSCSLSSREKIQWQYFLLFFFLFSFSLCCYDADHHHLFFFCLSLHCYWLWRTTSLLACRQMIDRQSMNTLYTRINSKMKVCKRTQRDEQHIDKRSDEEEKWRREEPRWMSTKSISFVCYSTFLLVISSITNMCSIVIITNKFTCT